MPATTMRYILLTCKMRGEDGQSVARCGELGISTCARTIDKAVKRIEEASALYVKTLDEVGERERVFREAGMKVMDGEPVPRDVDVHLRTNELVTSRAARLPNLAFRQVG